MAPTAFVLHLRRTDAPLVPTGALAATPAWGAIVVSFFVGAALIAALIDIPLFARTTVHRDSQLLAALVLVRFLVALPVGAVLGGYLTRRFSAGVITAAGMVLAASGFVWMTRWDVDTLESPWATVPLVVGGFGFGLALAPVNAAILASTDDDVHGLASAMVVVARMVGHARRHLGADRDRAAPLLPRLEDHPLPTAREVCDGKTRCTEFTDLLAAAGIPQEQAVFAGAAVCAMIAAGAALVVFRGAATRGVSQASCCARAAEDRLPSERVRLR